VSVIVTGSLAYDHIMSFPGYFKDHILPDKVHMLNVSFLVSSLKKQRGGTGGNIAYNAALLGLHPRLIAAAGSDFADYRAVLDELGVDTSGVNIDPSIFTASGFITTDRADNQITGFYPGAMSNAGQQSLHGVVGPDAEMAVIGPDDPAAMKRFPAECRELGLPYIYDPGMQLPWLSAEELIDGLTGARVLIGNDYEMTVLSRKTGLDQAALRERVGLLITTLGDQGAEIVADGETLSIPTVKVADVVDPTGAGDAFRAGLMLGLTRGFPLAVTGRLATLAGAYAVEQLGTQAHRYTPAEFASRFNASFPDMPTLTAELRPAAQPVGD
jgi:adenosine kinase